MSTIDAFFGAKWVDFIGEDKLVEQLTKVSEALIEQRKTHAVIPEQGDTYLFNFFKLTDPEDIKVVIPGLEPYHSFKDYIGLSFGTKEDKAPSTLKTLLEELEKTHGECSDLSLERWATRGIFLPLIANSTNFGEAYSHIEIWKDFSKLWIESLNRKDNIIWVLFGNHIKDIKEWITNPTHNIMEYGYPSSLNIDNPVVGSDCFKHIDYELEQLNRKVKWVN